MKLLCYNHCPTYKNDLGCQGIELFCISILLRTKLSLFLPLVVIFVIFVVVVVVIVIFVIVVVVVAVFVIVVVAVIVSVVVIVVVM